MVDVSPEAETSQDGGVDVVEEAGQDAPMESAVEASVDATTEAAQEAGTESQPEAGPEPATEAGPEPQTEASVEAAADAQVEAAQEASIDSGPLPCPAGMKRLPLSCVDVYEVTNKAYGDWLLTNPTPSQPPECAWNTSLVPSFGWPVLAGVDWQRPVAWIDWCDARAYCTSHGKRLCSKTEWLDACTSGGENTYTWGDGWYPGRCVTPPANYVKTQNVGSRPECQSPDADYAGVFDLTGNVWEWTSECSGSKCSARGSAFEGPGSVSALACDTAWPLDNNVTMVSLGFRCCAD
jgi:hypothetical protein